VIPAALLLLLLRRLTPWLLWLLLLPAPSAVLLAGPQAGWGLPD
jgi:hypothetical protein